MRCVQVLVGEGKALKRVMAMAWHCIDYIVNLSDKELHIIMIELHLRRFLVLLIFLQSIQAEDVDSDLKLRDEQYRSKRQLNTLPLVFPYGSTYRVILACITPIKSEDYISLLFTAGFFYQYVEFTNITQLSQYYPIKTVSREQRSYEDRVDERLVFYKAAEEMLNVKGFNGHDCMLRAICEVAQHSVEDEGLVGELIHILLTPNYGHSPFDPPDRYFEDTMLEYIDAHTAGRQMFDCGYIYRGCAEGTGFLELFTRLVDE